MTSSMMAAFHFYEPASEKKLLVIPSIHSYKSQEIIMHCASYSDSLKRAVKLFNFFENRVKYFSLAEYK